VDLKKVGEMIVDLRRSAWDKKTSDPATGNYNFTKIAYVPTKGTADCEHELTWSRYSEVNGYRELHGHRAEGYVPVLVSDGLYFPRGAHPNAAGMWQFEDVVLIMRPKIMELEKRANDVGTSDNMAKQILNRYDAEARGMDSRAEGSHLDIKRVADLV
jgi:hypothetical protein